MKQGIDLRRRSSGAFGIRTALLVVLWLVAGAAALWYAGARRDVSRLREEIARQESVLAGEASPFPEERAREVAARLRAVLDSGASATVAPTSVLRFVAAALPDEVVLSSLSIDAGPPDVSVTLEAETIGAERVSELQRRLSAARAVAGTELLEERLLADGRLAVRLRLDLRSEAEASR